MEFTKDQQDALDIMRSGANCFITGEAGTGKSFVVQAYIDECLDEGKEVLVTAPTGTAADNIGGMTIHRAFGAPIGVIPDKAEKSRNDVLEVVDVVIIDEISMCRFDLFDFVARKIEFENQERSNDRFLSEMNGEAAKEDIQLIVMGDFYQLPPVMTPEDKQALKMLYPARDFGKGYCFQSKHWNAFHFDKINLTENVRQEDVAFQKVLNQIRWSKNKTACITWLDENSSIVPFNTDDSIYLSATNKDVNTINMNQLTKLEGKEYVFYAESTGDIKPSEKFAEDEIHLKVGCKVMMTVNDTEHRYVNGTIGIVRYIHELFGETDIGVELSDGDIVCIGQGIKQIVRPKVVEKEKTVTEINEQGNPEKVKKMVKVLEEEVIGSFKQFPLRLAYAITIHKSQGKTFNHMNMNPYCWDEGQFYTGLSRCKKIENICFIQTIKPKYIVSSDEVIREFPS